MCATQHHMRNRSVRSLARSWAASRSSVATLRLRTHRLKTLAPFGRGGIVARNTFRRCRKVPAVSELCFRQPPCTELRRHPIVTQVAAAQHVDITSSRTPFSLAHAMTAECSQATLRCIWRPPTPSRNVNANVSPRRVRKVADLRAPRSFRYIPPTVNVLGMTRASRLAAWLPEYAELEMKRRAAQVEFS